MIMAAHKNPKPGVYRCFYPIDGRPAFYVIDYHGARSEDRRVEEDELETEVIADLSAALWAVRPREAGARAPRPVLRLL